MLSAITHVVGDNFDFQQDSAPAHRARDTIELLQRETPDFISPELRPCNSPDLISVAYKIWAVTQQRMYEMQIHNVDELKQRLADVWCGRQQCAVDAAVSVWSVEKASSTVRVFVRREDTSNICCRLFR